MFVSLSVCKQDYAKTTGLICMKLKGQGVAWAKENPIRFWSRSDLQGGSMNSVSLSVMLRDAWRLALTGSS